MLRKLQLHYERIRNHLGKEVLFGKERFRMHGYYANRLNHADNHEHYLTETFARELRERPGAFIDVGVNVGQTLWKVVGAERSRRYVGFEPQLGCCFFIDQFLQLNGLSNATLLPIALSDSNGTLTFHSANSVDETASLLGSDTGTGHFRNRTTHVAVRVGDEVLKELGIEQICAIKIDVEGAERQVLAGLAQTLETLRPTVFFEVLPNFFGEGRAALPEAMAERNRQEAVGIYAFLRQHNYAISQIDGEGREHPVQRFELDDREGYVSFNFVARAMEKQATPHFG